MRSARSLFIVLLLIGGTLAAPGAAAEEAQTRNGYSPTITVWLTKERVQGQDWFPNSTVSIEVFDAPGGTSLWSDAAVSVDAYGAFIADPWKAGVVLAPGYHIQVDGNFGPGDDRTRTLTLADLSIDSIDTVTDIVTGTAPTGMAVWVGVESDGTTKAATNTAGDWSVDLTDITDVHGGQVVVAYGDDGDGDETAAHRYTDTEGDPVFSATNDDYEDVSYLSGSFWAPNAAVVSVTVYGSPGGSVLHSATGIPTDGAGYWDLPLRGVVDFEPGMEIWVTDGSAVKTTVIQDTSIYEFDWTTDTIVGTAPPGASLWVGEHPYWIYPVADGNGDWSGDFGAIGWDVEWGDRVAAHLTDADGDNTTVGGLAARPRLTAWPGRDTVQTDGWGSAIDVAMEVRNGGVIYNNTETVDPDGSLTFDVGIDLLPGHTVTGEGWITGGHVVPRLVVADLSITGTDPWADTVSGTAPAGATVEVRLKGVAGAAFAIADGGGAWTADVSGLADLDWGVKAYAYVYDERWDRTATEKWLLPECNGVPATHWGTLGDDVIHGTSGNDVIVGFAGDDELWGEGGNDYICGDAGKDFIDGGDGNDWVWGGDDKDRIKGGFGRDRLFGEGHHDLVKGGPQLDEVWGGLGNDRLYGGGSHDTIFGQKGDDQLWGQRGNDILHGGPGEDYGDGGKHIDTCTVEDEIRCE